MNYAQGLSMAVKPEELERRMGYHPVRGDRQRKLYEDNRARFIALAEHISAFGPSSRELSLALTALQEALMWANAHIACNDVGAEDADVD